MNITEITKIAGGHKRRKRVGRGNGSGSGKTCGRGHKGFGQRSGSKTRGQSEGGQMPMFRRLPKRGFNNANFTIRYSVVNVEALEERFDANAHVTPQSLVEVGLVRNLRFPIKVLGTGELKKKLNVDVAKFSDTAKQKIEAAGGKATVSKLRN